MVNIKSTENTFKSIDPDKAHKMYLGNKYYKESTNTVVHVVQCLYCGDWFEYEITPDKVKQYMRDHNWHLEKGEKEHCGNSRCEGFHVKKISCWDRQEIEKGLDFYSGCDEDSKEFKHSYEKAMDNYNRKNK